MALMTHPRSSVAVCLRVSASVERVVAAEVDESVADASVVDGEVFEAAVGEGMVGIADSKDSQVPIDDWSEVEVSEFKLSKPFGDNRCRQVGEFVENVEFSSEMALMARSSFGLERASATTLALPCKYCISVVYSLIQASWYVCLIVCGSDFFLMEGTNDW